MRKKDPGSRLGFASPIWVEIGWIGCAIYLFQKHIFLHQLTHNMTKDCSLNYYKLTTCCVHKLF